MSFMQDKKICVSILKNSSAPEYVIRSFKEKCDIRQQFKCKDKAEELLIETCIQYGFIEIYKNKGKNINIRPCILNQNDPNYHSDSIGDSLVSDQSYRRGYDQGGQEVISLIKKGFSVKEIELKWRKIHEWRTQPIQELESLPGNILSLSLIS